VSDVVSVMVMAMAMAMAMAMDGRPLLPQPWRGGSATDAPAMAG
jgi:hypothetical protein